MSTKIYNAYKTTLNIHELLDKLKELAKKAKQKQEELYLESLVERVVFEGDEEIVLNAKPYNYSQNIHKKKSEDWKILKLSQYSIPEIDFSLTCSVFPLKDMILLKFYGENCMLSLIDDEKYLKDYHYQTQCDKPKHISDEEWHERAFTWNNVLGYNRPCDVSFNFELSRNDDIIMLGFSNKNAYIPTTEKRLENLKEIQKMNGEKLAYIKSDDELINCLPEVSFKW